MQMTAYLSARKKRPLLDHLNSIELDSTKFIKEKEESSQLAVLNVALNVNRETKKIKLQKHKYKYNHQKKIKS